MYNDFFFLICFYVFLHSFSIFSECNIIPNDSSYRLYRKLADLSSCLFDWYFYIRHGLTSDGIMFASSNKKDGCFVRNVLFVCVWSKDKECWREKMREREREIEYVSGWVTSRSFVTVVQWSWLHHHCGKKQTMKEWWKNRKRDYRRRHNMSI